MTAELDEVELRTDLGGSFRFFTEISWSKKFLDPCQTMSASIAADETRFDVLSTVQKGSFFTLLVNDAPQMSGIIDSREIESSRAGTVVNITGRDFMSRVVDANPDPRIVIAPTLPFDAFCQTVFAHFGFEDVTLFDDYTSGRNIAVKHAIKAKSSKGTRRRKLTDPAKALRPKEGEGGFQWWSRIAHPLGFHAWHMPNGSGICIGTPDYEQEPAYALVNRRSVGLEGMGNYNSIEKAKASEDGTGVPSDVYVRGKGSQPGAKATFIGHARNPETTLFKPFYVYDETCEDQAQCDAKARLVLSKAMLAAASYTVTVRGLAETTTRRIFNVDTVASIFDEKCGVQGLMWVLSRESRKSRAGGTSTTMTLIPCNALLMDYLVTDRIVPAPKDYAVAKAAVPKAVPPPANFMAWENDGKFPDRRKDG